MRRAIVAFTVVAGMALMMAGCGQEEAAPKKAGAPESTAVAPAPAEKAPAPKAPAEKAPAAKRFTHEKE